MNPLKKTARKILIAALMFAVLTAFAAEARASDTVRIYTYFNDSESSGFVYRKAAPDDCLTETRRAFYIYAALFGEICFLPPDVRLLDVFIAEPLMIINVSPEFTQYGGTFAERALVAMLHRNAWQIRGVGMITLWIDGRLDFLPEGTLLYESCIIQFGELF
jgi:hypothetical protein